MSDLTRQTQAVQQQQTQAVDRAAELRRKAYGTKAEITKALGDRIGADRFLRALATEINMVEHLDECAPETVLGGLFIAAQMGLEIGRERGLVWLIPRRNSKHGGQYEATLQIGYKGWVDLFYRAGARAVQWQLVREGDVFRIGSDSRAGKTYEYVCADPNSTARVTGAIAQIVTAGGGVVWEYMSRADIEKRSTGTNFWRDWWDEMALKTVMHRLAATAPLSEQLVLAQRSDETVQRRLPGIEQPVAEHLPLVATPTPAPAAQRPQETPKPTPAPARPQTPPRRPQETPAPPVEDQYVEEGDPDWEELQRREADAYLAEQEAIAEAERNGTGEVVDQ